MAYVLPQAKGGMQWSAAFFKFDVPRWQDPWSQLLSVANATKFGLKEGRQQRIGM